MMNSLNLKLAQRASKDTALMASLIDQYSEIKNLRWEDIANQLWIDNYRMAKLALCRRPREAKFSDDIAQVAHFVGVDQERLIGFIRSAESARIEQTSEKTKTLNKKAARQPARTYNRGLVWAFAVALLTVILLSSFVFFQPQASAATMLVMEGNVTVLKADKTISFISRGREQFIAAGKTAIVEAGDTIRVGQNGYVQLQLPDGSTIELFEGTEMQAASLNISESSYQVRLKLLTGRAVNRVKRLLNPGDFFEVITPSSTVSVRGTVFTVEVISPEITYVSCDEGVVQVSMGEMVVEVNAGEEVTAIVGEPLEVQPQMDWEEPAPGEQPTDLALPTPEIVSTPTIVSGTPTPMPDDQLLIPTDNNTVDLDPGDDNNQDDDDDLGDDNDQGDDDDDQDDDDNDQDDDDNDQDDDDNDQDDDDNDQDDDDQGDDNNDQDDDDNDQDDDDDNDQK